MATKLNEKDIKKIKVLAKLHPELDPRILEKDILVTRVIEAVVGNADTVPGLRPVFCGGTCLSKAYGIIARMSEDVDFKMVADPDLSASQIRKRNGIYKYAMLENLEAAGFPDIECKAFFRNSFFALRIPYVSAYPEWTALRPYVKAEFISRPVYIATEEREITTMADRLLDTGEGAFTAECQGIEEVLVEKILGFLRRSFDDGKRRRPALMRHVHDVAKLVDAGVRFSPELGDLFFRKVGTELSHYKNRSQKFAENPRAALLSAIGSLYRDPSFRKDYETAILPVLLDKKDADYDRCFGIFTDMAEKLVERAFSEERESPAPRP